MLRILLFLHAYLWAVLTPVRPGGDRLAPSHPLKQHTARARLRALVLKSAVTPTARKMVDCSSNNGVPNVAAYAVSGRKHLCRKVTEGTGYHWFQGDAVADQAHGHGIHVGHYHWLREDQDPTAQARAFVTAVKPHLGRPASLASLYTKAGPDGDWLMTDFEQTQGVSFPGDSTRAAQLRIFNAEVQRLLPTYPLAIYSGNWYLDFRPACQAEARKWPYIQSGYTAAVPANVYRMQYVAWQFTSSARVAGFAGGVDDNVWLGTTPAPKPTEELIHLDLTEKQLNARIDSRADARIRRSKGIVETMIAWALVSFRTGKPAGRWSNARHPLAIPRGGVNATLEARVEKLEKAAKTPKEINR